jgi:hypothetical protein
VLTIVNLGSVDSTAGVGVPTIVNRGSGSGSEVAEEKIVAVPMGSAPSPGI